MASVFLVFYMVQTINAALITITVFSATISSIFINYVNSQYTLVKWGNYVGLISIADSIAELSGNNVE